MFYGFMTFLFLDLGSGGGWTKNLRLEPATGSPENGSLSNVFLRPEKLQLSLVYPSSRPLLPNPRKKRKKPRSPLIKLQICTHTQTLQSRKKRQIFCAEKDPRTTHPFPKRTPEHSQRTK